MCWTLSDERRPSIAPERRQPLRKSKMDLYRIAASAAILALLISPARSDSSCGELEKYLKGSDQVFPANRGERRQNENRWKARAPFRGGDCEIAATFNPREFKFDCSFNTGGADGVRLASYQSLGSYVQNCLNSLESRDDWRKRDTSRTEFGGRMIAETTWTWTMLLNAIERQVVVSNDSGGPSKGESLLVVIWRERPKD